MLAVASFSKQYLIIEIGMAEDGKLQFLSRNKIVQSRTEPPDVGKVEEHPFKNDNLFYIPFLLHFFKASIHCAACRQDLCFPSLVSVGEPPTTLHKR